MKILGSFSSLGHGRCHVLPDLWDVPAKRGVRHAMKCAVRAATWRIKFILLVISCFLCSEVPLEINFCGYAVLCKYDMYVISSVIECLADMSEWNEHCSARGEALSRVQVGANFEGVVFHDGSLLLDVDLCWMNSNI